MFTLIRIIGIVLMVHINTVSSNQSATAQKDGWFAEFLKPTDRYGHAVLGNTPEWGKLCLRGPDAEACITLPEDKVFEDIAPRLADVNLDGRLDAVVVEADRRSGASLVVYQLNSEGRLNRVSNLPIGTPFRWLAPVGIADMDGDGYVEIGYIDRPHLAKVLRVWRFVGTNLIEIAASQGFSNHRIGDAFILGGLRDCAGTPLEMVTADSSWRNIMASRFDGKKITSRKIRPLFDDSDFSDALNCL